MGDPSLTTYFGVPSDNIVSYPSTIFLGFTSIQISAEPYSYVSISMNGVSHGVGLVDATGIIDLEIDPFITPGLAQLVITRQNRVPIIEDIEVIPNAGPYVIINSYEVHDDNNNIPEYDETITLDVSFENVGIEEALNVNATLSTDDNYVNITSNYVEIGDITAGSTVTITDAFEIDIADNIPDQHQIFFDVEIVGSSTWNSTINIIFNAPAFEIGNMIINDSGGNGILDPGETAILSVPLTNIGHATSQDIFTQLINGTPNLITLIEDSFNLTGLAPEEEGYADFDIEVNEGAEPGTIAILNFIATSSGYNLSNTFYLTICLVIEDFETGDFSMYPWEFIGNANWQITDLEIYEGVYSVKSGTISHNQYSTIFIELNVIADGEISFWKKVSCENDPSGTDYDYLAFYIDGNEQTRWDGEIDWSEESYFVAAGNHNFKWTYDKDGYVSSGQDCAWIDYIVFPPFEPEVSTDDMSAIPSIIKLYGNYPNPFNPNTTINYSLNKDSKVTIEIYNIKGQKVRTLVNKKQFAGYHTVMWNGKDNSGKIAASGLYFYKMVSEGNNGDYTSTKKMILLK
jgi:hypothetical protein